MVMVMIMMMMKMAEVRPAHYAHMRYLRPEPMTYRVETSALMISLRNPNV